MRIIAGPKQQPTKQPRFFAGGWASLSPLLLSKGLSGSYDMVFSTDTIYSTEQQQHFINCMVEVNSLSAFLLSCTAAGLNC